MSSALRFDIRRGAGLAALLILSFSFSSASGQFTLLYQKNGAAASDFFGRSVSSAGDVNGDGKADFIIGAYNTAPRDINGIGAGSAYVYSGVDGALLFQRNGAAAGDLLGYSVASAGDVDGDGKADFIIGAPQAHVGSFINNIGSAYVYSGATGALLYQKDGATTGDLFGTSVASSGDLNRDGKSDFIVGANNAQPGGLTSAGSAFVYSGATGALLYQKNGAAAFDNFGYSVASAGDVNGDGKPDFIIGANVADPGGLTSAGSAYLYSGTTGALLLQKDGATTGDQLGISVASAGDVNGDGRADFIIGAHAASPGGLFNAGSAYVYSLPCVVRGDVTNDAATDIVDIVALVQNVVFGTPLPNPLAGDVNCDTVRDVTDIVSLIQYVVFGTPTPCCL